MSSLARPPSLDACTCSSGPAVLQPTQCTMHEQAVATGSKRCQSPLSLSRSTQIRSDSDATTRSQHPLSRRSDAAVFSCALAARETVRATTRPRLTQQLHCASQSLHDARASSRNHPEMMRAAASTLTINSTSQMATQRLAVNLSSVAGRIAVNLPPVAGRMQPYSAMLWQRVGLYA